MSTLTNRIPVAPLAEAKKQLFAGVGVLDLAFEQVKEIPADLTAEAKKVQARVEAARTAVPAQLKTVPAQLKTLPSQVKDLRGEVETRVAKANRTATDLYSKLAVRGERLVTQIRRQPTTEAAIAEGKEAVKKAEAAATAAKKSVKAGDKAAHGAVRKLG